MVLNNMKNFLANAALTTSRTNDVVKGCKKIVDLSNDKITNYYASSIPFYVFEGLSKSESVNQNLNAGYVAICFGEGVTPVTAEDYKLENLITSSINLVSNSFAVTDEIIRKTKRVRTVKLIVQLQNNNEYTVNINEVGFLQDVYYNSVRCRTCLLHREVLPNQVAIEAGAIGTFDFEFTFTNRISEYEAEEGEF